MAPPHATAGAGPASAEAPVAASAPASSAQQSQPCSSGNNSSSLSNPQQQQQHATRVAAVDPSLLSVAAGAGADAYALPEAPGGAAAAAAAPLSAALRVLCEAGELLRAGQLVALPTETVYGLAANALDTAAVSRIFEAKGRPSDNPLIVHVSDLAMLRALYPGAFDPVPPVYAAAVAAHWPGPLTILLPASPLVPPNVTAGHSTMAVRMPSHPVARALIAAAGVPLAAPSANSSGRPSPTLAEHVVSDLSGRLPLVVDGGPCGCGVESTVLDGLRVPPAVLRPGGVSCEELATLPGLEHLQLHGREFRDAALEAAPTTPGMKYRHYSPAVPVVLVEPPLECTALHSKQQQQQQQQQQGDEDSEAVGCAEQAVAAAAARTAAGLRTAGRHRVALLRTTLPPGTPHGWMAPAATAQCSNTAGPPANGGIEEYCLGPMSAPHEVARRLFAGLRDAEAAGVDAIVVEGVAEGGGGAAVMNRLRKAASERVLAAASE